MLRSVKGVFGFAVHANDGNIGKIEDFYFDDEHWIIRYMVTEIGGWFKGKDVLISPVSFTGFPDRNKREFPVSLSIDKVKKCPDVDVHKPVSRQKETEILSYFNWPIYWQQVPGFPGLPMPVPGPNPFKGVLPPGPEIITGDIHLRSFKEIIQYKILANDGDIGHVDDIIADDKHWGIAYLVVDTHNWLPGGRVLVAINWLRGISWADAEVIVDLSREKIKNCPVYDPSKDIDREYEEQLYEYYGRPKYW
jgi:sporulation protein YlmC with PRC-barrel domain